MRSSMVTIRFSNALIGSMNFLSLIWSIFIILAASYILGHGHYECERESPVIGLAYGIFLLLLSLVAMVGAVRNHRVLLSVYVWTLVVWILVLVCVTAFLFVAAKAGAKEEYELEEYPGWLRRMLVDGKRWETVRKCMVKERLCKKLLVYRNSSSENDVPPPTYSPFLLSCCEPPPECGFVHKNGSSNWHASRTGIVSKDPDCATWNHKMDTLCYDCNTCKAGHIMETKEIWLSSSIFNLCFIAILVLVLAIAFPVLRQSQKDDAGYLLPNYTVQS